MTTTILPRIDDGERAFRLSVAKHTRAEAGLSHTSLLPSVDAILDRWVNGEIESDECTALSTEAVRLHFLQNEE